MYICVVVYVCMYVCMYMCMYVCMYMCVYVCMYVCICIHNLKINGYGPGRRTFCINDRKINSTSQDLLIHVCTGQDLSTSRYSINALLSAWTEQNRTELYLHSGRNLRHMRIFTMNISYTVIKMRYNTLILQEGCPSNCLFAVCFSSRCIMFIQLHTYSQLLLVNNTLTHKRSTTHLFSVSLTRCTYSYSVCLFRYSLCTSYMATD